MMMTVEGFQADREIVCSNWSVAHCTASLLDGRRGEHTCGTILFFGSTFLTSSHRSGDHLVGGQALL